MRADVRGEIRLVLLLFVLSSVWLAAIYASTFLISSASNDDYWLWTHDKWQSPSEHPQYKFFELIGRPLQAEIAGWFGCIARTVEALWKVRLITLALLATSMTFLAYWAFRSLHSKLAAFSMIGMIFVLPGIQAAMAWVAVAPFVFALLLGLVAAAALRFVRFREWFCCWKRGKKEFASAIVQTLVGGLVAIGAMWAALQVYPPWALSFFLPIMITFLFPRGLDLRDRYSALVRDVLFFLVVGTGYFLHHRLVSLPQLLAENPGYIEPSGYAFALTPDLLSKVRVFLIEYLPAQLNLWSVYPRHWVGGVVLAVILAGLLTAAGRSVTAWRGRRVAALRHGVLWLTAVVAILLLGNATLIIPSEGHGHYRMLFMGTAMLALVVAWALRQVCGLFGPGGLVRPWALLLAGLMVAGGALAYVNVLYSVLNLHVERRFIEGAIVQHLAAEGKLEVIEIIQPDSAQSLYGFPAVGDEFHLLSSSSDMYPWMIRSILIPHLRGSPESPTWRIPIILTRKQAARSTRKGTLVIDMSALQKPSVLHTQPTRNNWTLSASRVSGRHHIEKAFDRSTNPDDFWEVGGPFPVWITIAFPSPRDIRGYSYSVGENGSRLPSAWRVEGSLDGSNWTTVDVQEQQTGWRPYETRKFDFANPGTFSILRITFLAGVNPVFLRIYEISLHESVSTD